tara:strand:+ start:398 stop:871 length:474 start_codon:yes stop_codon:yes gene_type:complete
MRFHLGGRLHSSVVGREAELNARALSIRFRSLLARIATRSLATRPLATRPLGAAALCHVTKLRLRPGGAEDDGGAFVDGHGDAALGALPVHRDAVQAAVDEHRARASPELELGMRSRDERWELCAVEENVDVSLVATEHSDRILVQTYRRRTVRARQ